MSNNTTDDINKDPNIIYYNSAIPGIIDSNGKPNKIKNIKKYTDPNGDINICIDGPYHLDHAVLDTASYRVYIDKDTEREKQTVYSVTDTVHDYTDESNEETEDSGGLKEAVVYAITEINNPDYESVYLKISHNSLLLARGTYTLHVYMNLNEEITPNAWTKVNKLSLTVINDPIQGEDVNKQYVDTGSFHRP